MLVRPSIPGSLDIHRPEGDSLSAICTCGRPRPGSSFICGACAADLERSLGDCGFFAANLKVAYARQARITAGSGGRRSAETALPFDDRAGRLAQRLHNDLVGWCRILLDRPTTPIYGPTCKHPCRHGSCTAVRKTRAPGNTVAQMADWLLLHMGEIRRHEAAAEIVATIAGAVEAAERLVDRPADKVYAGPCDNCEEDLYARLDAAVVHCRCRAEYDVAQRRDWLLWAAEDTLASAATIARAVTRLGEEIRVERIWKWAERGQIIAHGVDERGRPLYRLGDVLDTLARMAVKKAG